MRGLAHLVLPVLVLGTATAPALGAPTGPSFALKAVGAGPSGYYTYDASPGGVIHGRVRVVNAGDAAGTARLEMVDATTGTTTGAVYETIGNLPSDVGAWVALDQRRVSLGPGQSAIVGFTLTVPAGARRGEHLGGIVAAPAEGPAAQGGESSKRSFHVNVVNQSVLAVQVNLPGAARSLLRVRGVKAGDGAGYQTLLLTLSNPGERMVRGSGTVRIADASGNVVGRQRFIIDAFLPRTRIDYPMVVRGRALLPGAYRATVTLDWGAGKRTAPFRFEVTRKNIKQAFGSKGLAQLPGESASSNGGGGLGGPILAGVLALLLGIGGSMLYFRRHTRRLEERLMARNAETGNEARSS